MDAFSFIAALDVKQKSDLRKKSKTTDTDYYVTYYKRETCYKRRKNIDPPIVIFNSYDEELGREKKALKGSGTKTKGPKGKDR